MEILARNVRPEKISTIFFKKEKKMKTTRTKTSLGGMLAIMVLVIAFMVCPAYGDLVLPYYGSTSTDGKAIWVSNTYSGLGATYGGFFYSAGQEGRGVFGQSDGTDGFGVKGWAANDGDVINYGGHFCSTGMRGVGVYGWAENTGDVENYGGMFLAEGLRGIGIHAKGGPNGLAAEFVGDICITDAGNGIIFSDGTKQTTAAITSTTGGGLPSGTSGQTLRHNGSTWVANSLLYNNGNRIGIGTTSPNTKTQLHVLGAIGTGWGTSAGALTLFPPDGYAWFHIDNGPAGGRPTGRLRISQGNNPGDNELISILQNGNVGIGTTNPEAKLHVNGDIRWGIGSSLIAAGGMEIRSSGGTPGIDFSHDLTSDYNMRIMLLNNNTLAIYGGWLYVYGGAAKSDGSIFWSIISDIRVKEVHGSYERGLSEVTRLNPVNFSYRQDNDLKLPAGKQFVGLVAQEVQKVVPEAVEENSDGYLMINSDPIIWAMVNSIKELKAENDQIKTENDQIKQRLDALEQKVNKQSLPIQDVWR
ncbi:MAG: tail fiber domain-containing protein [Sedimentisphaerales bacterium]|nr:tail fiber domain-containing protein [Sedimentisphaerales bacterium]